MFRGMRLGILTAVAACVALSACKGGDRYAALAKKANAARADAGEEVKPAPADATMIAHHQNGPRKIVVDSDSLFWLNDGSRGEGKPGIMKAPKGGGEVKAFVEGEGIMDFTADASNIYFLAPRAGKIFKAAKSGGEPTVIAQSAGIMRGVIADDTDVFWAENEAIFKISKNGGKEQMVVKEIVAPDYLTVDETSLYWYSSLSGIVMKAPKKGGGTAKVYANDKHTLHTIFISGPDLFVTFGSTGKGEIWKMGKSGGAVNLAKGVEPGSDYAVDSSNIYWATEDALYKMPRGGGTPAVMVPKTDRARNLTVDDASVYWTDRGGRVQKMAK